MPGDEFLRLRARAGDRAEGGDVGLDGGQVGDRALARGGAGGGLQVDVLDPGRLELLLGRRVPHAAAHVPIEAKVSMYRSAPEPSSFSLGITVSAEHLAPSAPARRARRAACPCRAGSRCRSPCRPAPRRSSSSRLEALLVTIFFGAAEKVVLAPMQSVTVDRVAAGDGAPVLPRGCPPCPPRRRSPPPAGRPAPRPPYRPTHENASNNSRIHSARGRPSVTRSSSRGEPGVSSRRVEGRPMGTRHAADEAGSASRRRRARSWPGHGQDVGRDLGPHGGLGLGLGPAGRRGSPGRGPRASGPCRRGSR